MSHTFDYGIENDLQAARIINAAFPNKFHKKIDRHIDAEMLSKAILYAKAKSTSCYLIRCIEWARDYLQTGTTCQGCKHLWMNNIGGYECTINAERVCIDKRNKYTRTMKDVGRT